MSARVADLGSHMSDRCHLEAVAGRRTRFDSGWNRPYRQAAAAPVVRGLVATPSESESAAPNGNCTITGPMIPMVGVYLPRAATVRTGRH
jgi:hypothetical protein